jgi:hypothetical protein
LATVTMSAPAFEQAAPFVPIKRYARTAGMLYLAIAVFGAFALGYVPSVTSAHFTPSHKDT